MFQSVCDFNRCLGLFVPTKQKKQNQTSILGGDVSTSDDEERVVISSRESSSDVDSTAGMVHQRSVRGGRRS